MNEDEVKKLYNALLSKGYSTDNIGDEETFIGKMGDKGNRKELYDWISSNNDFRIGDYEQYERRLAGNLQNAPTPPKQAVVSVPTQELPTGTAYGHDANGNEVSVRDDMDNALPTLPDGVQADANDKVQFADASHYKELADKIGNADYSINPAKKTTFADHVAKAADNMYMSRTANEHATRKQMESLSNDVERQYNEAYDKSFEKNKGMAASEQFITLVESDKDVSMLKSARHSLENARKMVAEADKAVKENNLEGAVFGTARGFWR